MADAGSIGVYIPNGISAPLDVLAATNIQTYPVYTFGDGHTFAPARILRPLQVETDRPLLGVAFNGSISGVVRDAGVPMAGAHVRLYSRQSGELLEGQWSAADGSYAFTHLEPGVAYTVSVVHSRLSVDGKNAITYDEVVAV